jgi:membrane protein YqaA with SNARE-associated domain
MSWRAGEIKVTDPIALVGLFVTCLAAGAIVPIPSEAAFVALMLTGDFSVWTLVAVATTGNVAGSTINWFIGLGAARFEGKPWFPASAAALERGRRWYHRYGRWSLLLSWLPLLGDPLTIVAGVMREPIWSFLIIVSIAKFSRYAMLAGVTLAWL